MNESNDKNVKSTMPTSNSADDLESTATSETANEVHGLKQRVLGGIELLQNEMANLQTRLQEFDEKNHFSETASEYLRKGLDDVKASLANLKSTSKNLFDTTAEVPIRAFSKAVAELEKAFDRLKTLANSFDEKLAESGVKQKLVDIIQPTREFATKILHEIATYVEQISRTAFAQLKGINDALRDKLKGYTDTGFKFVIESAANLDKKFDFEAQVAKLRELDAKFGATSMAKKLDEKYNLTENVETLVEKAKKTGKDLDEKYTEGKYYGKIEEAYFSGRKMVLEGLEKIQKDFDSARGKSSVNGSASTPTAAKN